MLRRVRQAAAKLAVRAGLRLLNWGAERVVEDAQARAVDEPEHVLRVPAGAVVTPEAQAMRYQAPAEEPPKRAPLVGSVEERLERARAR